MAKSKSTTPGSAVPSQAFGNRSTNTVLRIARWLAAAESSAGRNRNSRDSKRGRSQFVVVWPQVCGQPLGVSWPMRRCC